MEITIFKEVTTEGVITSIEENSKKYHDGLYADMNNLPERTMVKKGAAEIGDIIKQLKASRIAITKANTATVNKEHDAIVERLQVANKPFTDLLDTYNAERKVILDAEKARKQAVLDAVQYENDHEMGLLINKTFEYDRAESLRVAKEHSDRIEAEALKKAVDSLAALGEKQEQDKINAENARLANKDYVRGKNRAAVGGLMSICNLTEEQSKDIVSAIVHMQIPNITINY